MINIEKNFNKEINDKKVVVDFWTDWCGPCKMLGPVFQNAEKKYDNIKFCKYNVDLDENDICKYYGIMSIPTIILFQNGKEISRNIGYMNKEELNKFLGENDV